MNPTGDRFTMMHKNAILYIKHADSSFVLADQQTLGKSYAVKPFLLNQSGGKHIFLLRLLGMIGFVFRNRKGTVYLITWFADYHAAILSALGKLFGIPVIIFAGGQEAVSYPELGKGVYHHKIRGRFVKYALRNCSLIIPNHQSLIFHENHYYSSAGKKDGIRHYIPDLTTRIEIIPNGIDTTKYFRDYSIPKQTDSILTVGTMLAWSDFMNKGFDLFIQLAERNPTLAFTLIGLHPRYALKVEEQFGVSAIPNLQIIHLYCPDEVLFPSYNKAKVFIQASITEGMPNTLNEAMLCGCIPVGSDVNGIPDAMGGTGVLVRHRDIGELEQAVQKALTLHTEEEAIRYAQNHFTKEIRAAKIRSLLTSLDDS